MFTSDDVSEEDKATEYKSNFAIEESIRPNTPTECTGSSEYEVSNSKGCVLDDCNMSKIFKKLNDLRFSNKRSHEGNLIAKNDILNEGRCKLEPKEKVFVRVRGVKRKRSLDETS